MQAFAILMIPFVGTSLGAAMVFLMRGKMNLKLEKFLLGFASGVMIAASDKSRCSFRRSNFPRNRTCPDGFRQQQGFSLVSHSCFY